MPELRKDPVIGRWVIIASERSNRPGAEVLNPTLPVGADTCPFCESHELATPPEILAFRHDSTLPNKSGWWVRVVPNKFPAMQIEGQLVRMGQGMFDMMSGIGAHEVVIETPSHEMDMADMPLGQIEEVLWAYRERMIDLHRDHRFRYVLIFKNHGPRAGATLAHSHSQIIALPIVPKRVLEEVEGARNYYEYKERCVFCDVIRQEERDNMRIVSENELFIAFHPFASRFPYETWILPRQHESFFCDIQMVEVKSLAQVLKRLLTRLKTALGNPDYNFVIHTAPFADEDLPYFHWHIELIPQMSTQAGFEWGTGFYINSISPEDAARRMRGVDAGSDDDEQDALTGEGATG
ncbi:MAG TPA: galactose-1-phosphate uridylyltransferase [Candidatus Sumerlaeota bacterium]|nr:galactose-1-phosphate uridylyltransferase [Candidatus Sumerlaeota bacterium]